MVPGLNNPIQNDAEGWPWSKYDPSLIIQLVGFVFVDDTDLFCAGKTATTSGEALSPDFQAALHRWTGGLVATGGSFAAEKLFRYLIDFKKMFTY